MTDKGCVPSEKQEKKSQFDVHLLDSQPRENIERFRVKEAPWKHWVTNLLFYTEHTTGAVWFPGKDKAIHIIYS